MDVGRLRNLHLADEILRLMETKYKDYAVAPSVKFDRDVFKIPGRDSSYESTDIVIENIDTISAILREHSEGHRVLALNMANATRPGGGFLSGATAQEEDLFRCTNLSKALTPDLYPMRGTEIIYSPVVHILRDAEYKDLEVPCQVGFCSIAAHKDPYINSYGMLPRNIYNNTKCKVHMMFHLADIQKYDCLVLGALGCGAFNNPAQEIATIFCEISQLYTQKFKKIVYAIKCDALNSNCDVFKMAFLNEFKDNNESDEGESGEGVDRSASASASAYGSLDYMNQPTSTDVGSDEEDIEGIDIERDPEMDLLMKIHMGLDPDDSYEPYEPEEVSDWELIMRLFR